ncbi:MAG: methionyl-tRNA formyltransferase [Candidatus Pacebacteria bacterium]|nr:methionyl-tRNA formyltransferase [Candidatus Paceibacterota bacterium]
MKIAFFGTPDFTVSFLETLKEHVLSPSLVVTNPDRPSGRGMTLKAPGPKVWGQENDIKVLQPEKLNDEFFEELSKESWDLFVVIAYGKIIPERVINLPKYGTINVHYSLLPKYRGATPVESAILNGDKKTGIAIQQMRYELDSGPIFVSEEVSIDPTDTTPTLREKLNSVAIKLLPSVIKSIFDETIKAQEQAGEASHCKKISKEEGEINLNEEATTNDRKYRAYFGSIGTYFFQNDRRIKITKAHLEWDLSAQAGQFVIEEVIPENGKKVSYENLSS